ncbi:hypothetical protein [Alienimonas chondri]|uniref:Uncharacterized protein n=1 Tax=Alienimonas chondri TaxID=2681879 RepID=A0ABX1VDJ2_9PLAN|nr:hypothetical protein [Alienimonas chondri]NNJ26169.1 hypothetical protein [Alienimonas chondri]
MSVCLLIACVAAPPADAKAWNDRVRPTVALWGVEEGQERRTDGFLGFVCRIEPPVLGQIEVLLTTPADGERPRVIAGTMVPTRFRPQQDANAATAIVNLRPPTGGWPEGPAEVRVTPVEMPHLRTVRRVRFAAPNEPVESALLQDPFAADAGTLLDWNAAAAMPDVPFQTPAGQRFRVRGVARMPAPQTDDGADANEEESDPGNADLLMVEAVLPADPEAPSVASAFAVPFFEGTADDEGARRAWFETELIAPKKPGDYRLNVLGRIADDDGFPPLILRVERPTAGAAD